MAKKVIVPQKKIMSRSFLNSGTLIVNVYFLGYYCILYLYNMYSTMSTSISSRNRPKLISFNFLNREEK